jgi:SAM-dependent methyltransferase
MTTDGPNAEQQRHWNETVGPTWVRLNEQLDRMIAPAGQVAMDRAALVRGERVLDVGCGCGDSTLEIARRVGAAGVMGIDLSAPMLALARERAVAAGLPDVRFEQADAQVHAFAPASVDVVYSRFGVMFFADPVAAFANLRRALRPGGRLVFVCWQELPVNPWALVPLGAVAEVIPLPPPPAAGAPGPFSMGDRGRVQRILEGAGFVDVRLDPHEATIAGASTLDDAAEFMLQMGPAAAALREAPDPALRPRVAEAVRAALAPYMTAEGLRMRGAVWIVTARTA